jgi:hypothetical protein
MGQSSGVRAFDIVIVALIGSSASSYLLGLYCYNLPPSLIWIATFISKLVPISNFTIEKLSLGGQIDEVPRFLFTSGISNIGFLVISIFTIRAALKCPQGSVPFDVGFRSFCILLIFSGGIGVYFFVPYLLDLSGKLTKLSVLSDFRYVVYFGSYFFLITTEFLIVFQAKKYFKGGMTDLNNLTAKQQNDLAYGITVTVHKI